eukprot:SAG22_NODE_12145_length_454_cov_1.957746_1_plen_80_part_01
MCALLCRAVLVGRQAACARANAAKAQAETLLATKQYAQAVLAIDAVLLVSCKVLPLYCASTVFLAKTVPFHVNLLSQASP